MTLWEKLAIQLFCRYIYMFIFSMNFFTHYVMLEILLTYSQWVIDIYRKLSFQCYIRNIPMLSLQSLFE